MMAGGKAAIMTSALLKNSIAHLQTVLADVQRWMSDHEYTSIRQVEIRGKRISLTNLKSGSRELPQRQKVNLYNPSVVSRRPFFSSHFGP